MAFDESESPHFQAPTPWEATPEQVYDWLSRSARLDSMLLWLLELDRPAPDGVVLCHGFAPEDVSNWIGGGFRSDSLFQRAMIEGFAEANSSDQGAIGIELPTQAALMAHVQPETVAQRLMWLGLFAREGEAFSGQEREIVAACMKLWQASFNRPSEAGLSRLLVGADNRLIHADPVCQLMLLRSGVSAQRLVDQVRQIRDQRWPDAGEDSACDMAIEVGDGVSWIVCRWEKAIELPEAHHWIYELRPLAMGELPPVGVLADERIALALAYIHDHFNEGPSLAEIARHVHVSPFHFHRVFTRQVGVSPKHYLQMKQMQAARWRLRSQRTPIGRIARETGFSSHGHFTATFGRVVGVSPTTYRNRAGT